MTRIRNRKLRFFAAITLSLLASGISTTSASANSLTSTTPISGAILNSAPSAVSLVTQSPLANMGSEITVSDPNGAKVDDGTLTIDGGGI